MFSRHILCRSLYISWCNFHVLPATFSFECVNLTKKNFHIILGTNASLSPHAGKTFNKIQQRPAFRFRLVNSQRLATIRQTLQLDEDTIPLNKPRTSTSPENFGLQVENHHDSCCFVLTRCNFLLGMSNCTGLAGFLRLTLCYGAWPCQEWAKALHGPKLCNSWSWDSTNDVAISQAP